MAAEPVRSICWAGTILIPAGTLSIGSSLPPTGDMRTLGLVRRAGGLVTGAGLGGVGAATWGAGAAGAAGAGDVLGAVGGGRAAFFFGATTSIFGNIGAVWAGACGASLGGSAGGSAGWVSPGAWPCPRAAWASATAAIKASAPFKIRIRPPDRKFCSSLCALPVNPRLLRGKAAFRAGSRAALGLPPPHQRFRRRLRPARTRSLATRPPLARRGVGAVRPRVASPHCRHDRLGNVIRQIAFLGGHRHGAICPLQHRRSLRSHESARSDQSGASLGISPVDCGPRARRARGP